MLRVFIIILFFIFTTVDAEGRNLFESPKGSIVMVNVVDSSGRIIAEDRGYVIDKDGLIATGCNVILMWYRDIGNDLIVRAGEGKDFPIYRLIVYNPPLNLAIFKINYSFPVMAIPSDKKMSAYIRRTVKVYRDMVRNPDKEAKGSGKLPESHDQMDKQGRDRQDALSETPYIAGLRYLSSKRYREAIEEFNKALETEPRNPEIYLNLGLTYYKIDRYKEAIDSFEKALTFGGESKSIYNKLGTLYLISGDYDAALRSFKRSLSIDSKDPKTHFNIAITLLLKGDRDSAWQEYVELRSIDEELARRLWDIIN